MKTQAELQFRHRRALAHVLNLADWRALASADASVPSRVALSHRLRSRLVCGKSYVRRRFDWGFSRNRESSCSQD